MANAGLLFRILGSGKCTCLTLFAVFRESSCASHRSPAIIKPRIGLAVDKSHPREALVWEEVGRGCTYENEGASVLLSLLQNKSY